MGKLAFYGHMSQYLNKSYFKSMLVHWPLAKIHQNIQLSTSTSTTFSRLHLQLINVKYLKFIFIFYLLLLLQL